jgi:FlaA1/EpsC-like NDP-sugar epimerase
MILGQHGFMDMAETILITGATGTVGSEIMKQLLIAAAAAARRWVVVERMNSWHNRFRKLLIRC